MKNTALTPKTAAQSQNLSATIDGGGDERTLAIVGTCRDGTTLYREVDSNGVVGDNADGVRLFADLEQYLDALPDTDRAEVQAIFEEAR